MKIYKCFGCGGVYDSDKDDEAAEKEYAERFPDHADEAQVVLCDDCYQDFSRQLETFNRDQGIHK